MKKLNQQINLYRVNVQLNRFTKTAFAFLIFSLFYSQASFATFTAAMQATNTCGANSGGVSVCATGGTGGYVYQWASSGAGATDVSAQTGSYITGVSPGTYFVTVTDGAAQSTIGNVIVSNTINNFTVSPDVTLCPGDSVQLHADGADIYSWSPIDGLSNSNIANPVAFPTVTTTYTVTGYKSTGNLVFNGDFSQGNIGFTSGYNYISSAANTLSVGGNTGLVPEANYAVDINAHDYHPRFYGVDHPTGTGNFMIVNGAEIPDVTIWNQTVNNVIPNTEYFFSTWISSLNNINAYANLKFSINGLLIGPIINSPVDSLHWIQFYVSWNSGSNTSAAISIVNANTIAFGNDFGLDDISFTTACPATQQVTVMVNPAPNVNAGIDQTVCAGQPTLLAATNADSTGSYSWSDGGTTQSVTVTPLATTVYYVTVTNPAGCNSVETVTVFVATDEIQPVAICKDYVQLYLNDTGNATITFFDVDAGSYDNCGAVASLTTSEASFNCSDIGVNIVTLTVTDGTGNTSSCISTVTVADSTSPVALCKDVTVTLVNGHATISESDINNGSYDNCAVASLTTSTSSFNCSNIGANTVTLTVIDTSGNSASCNATVTVLGQGVSCSIASLSSVNQGTGGSLNTIYIGYGPQSITLQVNVTGTGPFIYSWSPDSSLSCSNCANPTFTPTAQGNYHFTVTVTNADGCATTCNITIHVRDIREGGNGNGNKVYVCHNNHTILISSNAVAAHLRNHSEDYLGQCNQSCACNQRIGGEGDETGELINNKTAAGFDLVAYPNPFSNQINLRIDSESKELFAVRILDIAGMLISDIKNVDAQNDFSFGNELASGIYLIEVQQSNFKKVTRIIKQ